MMIKYKFLWAWMLCLLSMPLLAQENTSKPVGLHVESFRWLSEVEILNPEKDTYLKLDQGFILDNEKPPYTFKFSDDIVRKVFVYKVYEMEQMQQVGQLFVFKSSAKKEFFKLPVPGAVSDPQVWEHYIDQIKAGEAFTEGFATCVAFILTREAPTAGDMETASEEEESYEYCFPGDAQVLMHDGTFRRIDALSKGDLVWTAKHVQKGIWKIAPVDAVVTHRDSPTTVLNLKAIQYNQISASTQFTTLPEFSLNATANHPILTQHGHTPLEEIRPGDIIYRFDFTSRTHIPCRVTSIQEAKIQPKNVYNLHVQGDAYIVDGIVVFEK